MFSSPAPEAPAFAMLRDLFDTHTGFHARATQAWMAGAETAMEQQVDAMRTLFATVTVASRQCVLIGGAWLNPLAQLAPATPAAPRSALLRIASGQSGQVEQVQVEQGRVEQARVEQARVEQKQPDPDTAAAVSLQ